MFRFNYPRGHLYNFFFSTLIYVNESLVFIAKKSDLSLSKFFGRMVEKSAKVNREKGRKEINRVYEIRAGTEKKT